MPFDLDDDELEATRKLYYKRNHYDTYREIETDKTLDKMEENKMKKDLTEIIFVLDRSGSMSSLAEDTIGGFNSYIESQKKEKGRALVTTVLFDNEYEILHNGVNLNDIQPLTDKEYFARGTTALLDAVGKTILDVGARLNKTPEEERPEKVIMIITTDGQENASREFTKEQLKKMIEEQQNKYSWQFIFLGANIDAVQEAADFGISPQCASNYVATRGGTKDMWTTMNSITTQYRDTGKIEDDWNKNLK